MTSQSSTWEEDKQCLSDNIRQYCLNSTANETLIKDIVEIVKSYESQDQKQIIEMPYTTAKSIMLQLDVEATRHSETSLNS